MTSHHWAQFTVGRIVAYFAVGLVENAVPAYNAETAPPAVRGLLAGSIMFVTGLGNFWGAGMSRAYSTATTKEGWLIPVAMQFIPAIGILALVPFTPESPRWLVLKGHKQKAKANLDKIRHKADVDSGATAAEIDALELLIEDSFSKEQGSWLDLFKGNYLRRTWVRRSLPTNTLAAVRLADSSRSVLRCSSSSKPTGTNCKSLHAICARQLADSILNRPVSSRTLQHSTSSKASVPCPSHTP